MNMSYRYDDEKQRISEVRIVDGVAEVVTSYEYEDRKKYEAFKRYFQGAATDEDYIFLFGMTRKQWNSGRW